MSRSERGNDRAVFVDLDGTLVDTLPVLKNVYRSFVAEYGCIGSEDEFERLNGLSLTEIVVQLAHTHRLPGGPDELYERYLALIHGAYAEVTSCAGAEDLHFTRNTGALWSHRPLD
jgi:beta-phosphoglucomutase-like phosphatase (HAD superfamily)